MLFLQAGWRRVVAAAVSNGIPAPCLSTALSFFDGYRLEKLPANLIQVMYSVLLYFLCLHILLLGKTHQQSL